MSRSRAWLGGGRGYVVVMRLGTRLLSPLTIPLAFALTGCPDDGDDDGDEGAPASEDGAVDESGGPTTGDDDDDDDGTADGGSTDGGSGGSDGGTADETDGGSGDSGGGSTGEEACGPAVELGSYTPEDGDARGMAIDGDTLYLAVTSAGLEIVDVTDAAAATRLGGVDFDTGELAQTVVYADGYAYVGQRGSGWVIVDVSDPADPMTISADDSDDAEDVAIDGTVFFVLDSDGIRTYDVTDAASPSELSPQVVFPGSSESFALAGDHAYIAAQSTALVVADVSDASAPTEAGTWDADGNGGSVAVGDGVVYVSHSEGLAVIDVSDPANPTELGTYVRDNLGDVAVVDGVAYVLGGDTATTEVPTLAVIDLSDPANPIELDTSFDDYDDPAHILVSDGRVFISVEDDDSVHVLDPCPPA